VKRDGKWTNPNAAELVPGDVIRLRLGDIVPADARLLAGDSIEVDQSALTGESLPVNAQPGAAVFSGSIVRQGEIDAMVYATGSKTYFGKTAQLVQEAQTVSHFQRAVLKIGDYLIVHGILPGASGSRDSGGHAHGALRNHGGGSAPAGEKGSHRNAVVSN
jgi:H+-transporting ATPase